MIKSIIKSKIMSAIDMPVTNYCVITQLELIEKDISCIKESLFNWVVEMDKFEFNRLCSEIISIYDFWEKYQGVKVCDEKQIIQPYISSLQRVDIIIRTGQHDYDQKQFYQWLQETNEFVIQDICIELESLWDLAIENTNSYVIDPVFNVLKNNCEWWILDHGKPEFAAEVKKMLGKCNDRFAVHSHA